MFDTDFQMKRQELSHPPVFYKTPDGSYSLSHYTGIEKELPNPGDVLEIDEKIYLIRSLLASDFAGVTACITICIEEVSEEDLVYDGVSYRYVGDFHYRYRNPLKQEYKAIINKRRKIINKIELHAAKHKLKKLTVRLGTKDFDDFIRLLKLPSTNEAHGLTMLFSNLRYETNNLFVEFKFNNELSSENIIIENKKGEDYLYLKGNKYPEPHEELEPTN